MSGQTQKKGGPMQTRRKFLAGAGAVAASGALAGAVRAAMGPNDKFDLLIKGGDVLDPSQRLRGRRDIGIRFGAIEAIEPRIADERASRVLEAAARLVPRGPPALHAHPAPSASATATPAAELVPSQATTPVVSAGDAGANNFAPFRRHIVAQTRTRMYGFVHIANMGL